MSCCTTPLYGNRCNLPGCAPYTDEVIDDLTAAADSPSRDRPRRRGRRALAVLVAVVLLLGVGAVAAYVLLLNHTVTTNVQRSPLLPTPGVSGATPPPTKKPAATKATNILVIGSDARPGESASRSDVIVLMHIAGDAKSVHLVHFPRDLYVDIPGRGKDKINAAFAYGRAPLLVQTVQNLVGVPVDQVAMVDFEGFKRMTDAVGGVSVYVEEPSTSEGYTFSKGNEHMGGAEALAFVRERKQLSEGDISRGRRQQAFIKALMLKALSREVLTNPVRLAEFVDAATQNLTVDENFSVAKMRTQAFTLRGLRGSDIGFVTAPFTGYGTAPDGGSIDILDEEGMRELGEALQNDAMVRYQDVTRTP